MKLKAKAALAIPYDASETGVMQVRAAASDSINVYAIRREALAQYKRTKDAPTVSASPVAKTHELFVQLPAGSPWNLIIENPWEHEVEVNYAVTALAPSKPVVISGSVVTTAPTVSGSLHVTGPRVTAFGTAIATPPAAASNGRWPPAANEVGDVRIANPIPESEVLEVGPSENPKKSTSTPRSGT